MSRCDFGVSGAESHPEVALFFYAFVIIGGFFAVNLFVGVVVDQFGRMKDEFEGSALLTKDQQQWCVHPVLIVLAALEAPMLAPLSGTHVLQ